MHTMLSQWAPPLERTRMVTIAYSGMHAGTVFTLLMSGILAEYWGWESIFYFFGACACFWYLIWITLAYETPESHPRISPQERSYIMTAIGHTHPIQTTHIPWNKFLLSMPVWAICAGHFGNNWGFYTLLTNLPTYLSNILHFSLKENGVVSALPYFFMAIGMPLCGFFADRMRRRHVGRTTIIRRIFHFIGQIVPAVCLVILGYIGCNVHSAVGLLIMALGSTSFASAGFQVNHIDISPSYAGILMGLSNTVATIPGIAAPYVVGLVTSGIHPQTVFQWRQVFYISAAIYVATAVFYVIFASGEPQSWEKKKVQQEPDMHLEKTSLDFQAKRFEL